MTNPMVIAEKGAYLSAIDMAEYFCARWGVLKCIVTNYINRFKPKKVKGQTCYFVDRTNELFVDRKLDHVYRQVRGNDPQKVFSNLEALVTTVRKQIQSKKEISQKFIELLDTAYANAVRRTEPNNLEECVFADAAYEAAHMSMNGHRDKPIDFLLELQKSAIVFPSGPISLKYTDADIKVFVEKLYTEIVYNKNQLLDDHLFDDPDHDLSWADRLNKAVRRN